MDSPKWTLWLLWAVWIVALAGLFAAVAGGGAPAPAKRRRATRVLQARRGLHPAPSPEPSFLVLVLPESRLTPGFVQVEQCPCGVRPDGTQAAGTEDHSDVSAAGVVMTPGRRRRRRHAGPTHRATKSSVAMRTAITRTASSQRGGNPSTVSA